MKKYAVFLIFCVLFIYSHSLSVDELQVNEAKKNMEKAFSDYASYISLNSADDEYAKRLYHNYTSLKGKYETIKAVYEASRYKADNSNTEYFFSAREEAAMSDTYEINAVSEAGPVFESDYRLGWFMYINGQYEKALELFKLSIKKSEQENNVYYEAYLGLARVYTFLAENMEDRKVENITLAKKNLNIFKSNFINSDDIRDRKLKYLMNELQNRLNYLSEPSDKTL
jgi:tetratricopeptide (TPR) repeat protein